MKIANTETNSAPLVLHAQGYAHTTKEWMALVEAVKGDKITGLPGSVTVVTYHANRVPRLLLEQLEASGVPCINAAQGHKGYWQNVYKIKYLHAALAGIQTEYVLSLDALDVMLADDQSGLLERFAALGCDALFGATKNCFPTDFEADAEETTSHYKYLNAGTLLGKTAFLREYYDYLMANEYARQYPPKINGCEQVRVRSSWPAYRPRIRADYGCAVFQTLSQSAFALVDGTVQVSAGDYARRRALRAVARQAFGELPEGKQLFWQEIAEKVDKYLRVGDEQKAFGALQTMPKLYDGQEADIARFLELFTATPA